MKTVTRAIVIAASALAIQTGYADTSAISEVQNNVSVGTPHHHQSRKAGNRRTTAPVESIQEVALGAAQEGLSRTSTTPARYGRFADSTDDAGNGKEPKPYTVVIAGMIIAAFAVVRHFARIL